MPPRVDLTQGNLTLALLRLAGPMTIGIFSVFMFNLADTLFVSRLGTQQLAAMSFTFPVAMVLMGVSFALSTGTASVVSRAIGRGDETMVKRLASDSLSLSFLTVTLVTVAGMLTIDPLFTALGAGPDVLPLIRDYMLIWYPGVACLVIPIVANASIRAGGDTKFPATMMVGAMLTNLALDPIFIFGWFGVPRMELQGAAVATIIARALTMVASLAILHFRDRLLDFRTPSLSQVLESWRQISSIAIPVAATNIMQPIAMAVVTRLIADYGPAAVAAWGAGERVSAFVMVPVFAVCSGLVPIVGQNWGAGEYDRVRKVRNMGFLFAFGWGILMMGLIWLSSAHIATIFGTDPELTRELVQYLWIMPIGYALYGVLNVSEETLNAVGRPMLAAGQTVIHMFALYAPLALAGAWWGQMTGLLWGVAVANALGGLIAYGLSVAACSRQVTVSPPADLAAT
ncbi:MAG: MATE family efflux transporter [Gemmatimonadetes bacterium]|nr:MATE family efflux transporter [Gemmatimonadota bacterium]MBT4611855.1 MATE family efflux transporter [Gemmatimonadota bacterium]MBT5055024.1 MATE family efflux transporter [Gemmatimonadota bacterium]MBT5143347.1 MATE family efflux transporter [Gemmatimonadota bacterium]MBT5586719.1 MATE family efflux transporter [Gemmatimonadota bacterium]